MPGKFRFGLQPLLDRRRHVEEEKRREYAARRREVDETLRENENLRAALRAVVEESPRVSDLAYIDAAIVAQQRRGAELEAALEHARNALILACRDRRAIEKLLERRRRAYEAERAHREELEIDEANAR